MGTEKIIEITDPHRLKHLRFFKAMHQPHFLLTAHEDIGPLLTWGKERKYPFTPLIVWCLSKIAHEIPEFRWRFRGDTIVEHERVRPSFTVLTEASDVFSFCTVPYQDSLEGFIADTHRIIEEMQRNPSFEDEEGKDDYLFMSAIPWVSFTNLQHAMGQPPDSVPRIAWGKYYSEGEKVLLPLSVQAHHALVDGRHMGHYFERFRNLCAAPESLLE